jgi:hypothetical protein
MRSACVSRLALTFDALEVDVGMATLTTRYRSDHKQGDRLHKELKGLALR